MTRKLRCYFAFKEDKCSVRECVRMCVCLQSTFSRSTFDVLERAVRVNDVPGLSKSRPDAKRALKPYNLTGEQAARGSKIKMAFSQFVTANSYSYLEIQPSVYSWVLQGFSNLGRFITEVKASVFAWLYPESHERADYLESN